jgi:cobalt-precorrin-5B (C1)-methyltransferase
MVGYRWVMNTRRKGEDGSALRRGWTTGACATAATKAALTALLTGDFPDPVTITLPKGETPSFALARENLKGGVASAAIVKDAGDDPDVTHGATVWVEVSRGTADSGIAFRAGKGVGTITKPGLPVPVGEAAINPVPRQMMTEVASEVCTAHSTAPDMVITVGVENGQELAAQTWNPRLGIVGGLSILGTTGIVHPFSCSAWIHSIYRGVDVARAEGYERIIAATGSTSEDAARALRDVPETALIDMGDFAGGLLKYLRQNPVPNLTLAGGFAKMVKLAQGSLDLHSARSQVDFDWLADLVADAEIDIVKAIQEANTAAEALEISKDKALGLEDQIAQKARQTVLETLRGAPVAVELLVINRAGKVVARDG